MKIRVKKCEAHGREFLKNFADWYQFIIDIEYYKQTNIINDIYRTKDGHNIQK